MDENLDINRTRSVTPPEAVFERPPVGPEARLYRSGAKMHIFTGKITVPEEGGLNLHFKGLPYPKKGFAYPEAAMAINTVKRQTIMLASMLGDKNLLLPAIVFMLFPYKKKLKIFNNLINHYCNNSWFVMQNIFLKENYMTPCCQEIRKFITHFLINLGISVDLSNSAAAIFSHLIEYDDAYRYRIEDLMSETSKSELKEYPRQTFKRLMDTFGKRDKNYGFVERKFRAFSTIISFLLLSSKIRIAYDIAIDTIDVKKMQLDEADHYHCLSRDDYDFFGLSIEERLKEYDSIHKGKTPPMVEYTG